MRGTGWVALVWLATSSGLASADLRVLLENRSERNLEVLREDDRIEVRVAESSSRNPFVQGATREEWIPGDVGRLVLPAGVGEIVFPTDGGGAFEVVFETRAFQGLPFLEVRVEGASGWSSDERIYLGGSAMEPKNDLAEKDSIESLEARRARLEQLVRRREVEDSIRDLERELRWLDRRRSIRNRGWGSYRYGIDGRSLYTLVPVLIDSSSGSTTVLKVVHGGYILGSSYGTGFGFRFQYHDDGFFLGVDTR